MSIVDDFRTFLDLEIDKGSGVRELARKTGLQPSTVSRIVNRKVVPDIETMDKMLNAFGFRLSINKVDMPPI